MTDKEKVYWGSVIKKSFYYTEYTAYEINELSQGIILTKWEKTYDQEDCAIGRLERIYFKTEWILPVINLIRSIPKKELDRGTDDSGYGEWERKISLASDNSTEKSETTIVFTNRDYDRSSPKLEIYIYSDKSEKLNDELSPYAVWENDRLNNIYLPHGHHTEGYIEYIEPILIKLEKYVPQKERKKINSPLGKPKTELEKITEIYEHRISENPQKKNEPYLQWIKKQTDNNYYDITALVFFEGKLNYEKTLSCNVFQMAMINKYFKQWSSDIKTIPYKKENIDLKIEISDKSEYENYLNVKIFIFEDEDDYFEIPVSTAAEQNPFYDLCSFTEAEKISTHYLRGLHAFLENENLVLKWYYENYKISDEHSNQFLIEKTQVSQFLKLFKELENIYLLWHGDFGGEYINNPNVFLEYGYREKGDFEFRLPGSTALPVTDFYVRNNKINGSESLLSLKCFGGDFLSELQKIIKCVEKAFYENPAAFFKKDYAKVYWELDYDYAGQYSVHYFIWQFEGHNKNKKIKLPKELIYRIEEYSFWWWQATDHNEKLTFEDVRLFFEINPASDKTGLGTVEINFKKIIDASVKAYFDLSDGNNLPKSFYGNTCKERIVRKVEINKTPDLKYRSRFFSKKDKMKPSNYIFINYYESKYLEIEKNEEKFWAIEKCYFDDFKNSLNEIYEYLKIKKNKIAKLLEPELKNIYDKKGFHIDITEQRLAINCDINLKPDDYIPLDITIYSKSGFDCDCISLIGSRKILLWQMEILIAALNKI
ncbi:MAG: hypothetical protein PUC37_12530 [Spirochaetales bacterium]|nr:hypothetical protein [Spirochaetales bacterium]